MKSSNVMIGTPLISLLLQITTILLTTTQKGYISAENPIRSSTIVKDVDGNNVGPQIELSSTVLKTGEKLTYICREGDDIDFNTLYRKVRNGNPLKVDQSDHADGGIDGTVCSVSDYQFWCIIVTGEIIWDRAKGGEYFCLAYPKETYVVHWIDPGAIASGSRNLGRDQYGANVKFYCGVDMTPTDINYERILRVQWEYKSPRTLSEWAPLTEGKDFKMGMASMGANASLEIVKYNAITHGGSYRCKAHIQGYGTNMDSESFDLSSDLQVRLVNSKRDTFHFGVNEDAVITCFAESYPFPAKIEILIQNKVISSQSPGVRDYIVDRISTSEKRHFARFTVTNATAAFGVNGTFLHCRAVRPDGKADQKFENIILLSEPPPTRPPTSTTHYPGVKPYKEPVSPWVIAIAVIIPVGIILIIVVIAAWKWKRFGELGGGNDYETSHYYAPSNDLNRSEYDTFKRNRAYRNPSQSLGSQRKRAYDSQSLSSQPSRSLTYGGQYGEGHNFENPYSTARANLNPIYGRNGGANALICDNPYYGEVNRSMYSTPVVVARKASFPRRQEDPGYLPVLPLNPPEPPARY